MKAENYRNCKLPITEVALKTMIVKQQILLCDIFDPSSGAVVVKGFPFII